ncbi:hypothetical protein COD94_06385 [Bacillus cereus]|nr:hypothetical protein COD94_06385 [Bacillus cereus]
MDLTIAGRPFFPGPIIQDKKSIGLSILASSTMKKMNDKRQQLVWLLKVSYSVYLNKNKSAK